MIIAPVTVGDVVERNAKLFPSKTAVVFEGDAHEVLHQRAMQDQ